MDNPKKDKEQTETVIKYLFYILLNTKDLTKLIEEINVKNTENMKNILIAMINGKSILKDNKNKMTLHFGMYDTIVKSSGFYNIFPQKYAFYKSTLKTALMYDNSQNSNSSSKVVTLPEVSKEDFFKLSKEEQERFLKTGKMPSQNQNNASAKKSSQNDANNDPSSISKELKVIYRYVHFALFFKLKLVELLFYKYSTEFREVEGYTQNNINKFLEQRKKKKTKKNSSSNNRNNANNANNNAVKQRILTLKKELEKGKISKKYIHPLELELTRFYKDIFDSKILGYLSPKYADELTVIVSELNNTNNENSFFKKYHCKISDGFLKFIREGNKGEKLVMAKYFKFTNPDLIPSTIQLLHDELLEYNKLDKQIR